MGVSRFPRTRDAHSRMWIVGGHTANHSQGQTCSLQALGKPCTGHGEGSWPLEGLSCVVSRCRFPLHKEAGYCLFRTLQIRLTPEMRDN